VAWYNKIQQQTKGEKKMLDTTYNGWTNRETWSANLLFSNDEGAYRFLNTQVQLLLSKDSTDKEIVDLFRSFGEMLTDRAKEEVGDLDKVDWLEIGKIWIDES
jgi:hypothetical protein